MKTSQNMKVDLRNLNILLKPVTVELQQPYGQGVYLTFYDKKESQIDELNTGTTGGKNLEMFLNGFTEAMRIVDRKSLRKISKR